jgi:nucleolar pre-ribosomal-associated protein 2
MQWARDLRILLTIPSAVLANADQARNTTYITEAFEIIRKKVHSTKKPLNFAVIGIFEVALAAFHEKEMALNDHDIIRREDLEDLTASFTVSLVNQLKTTLAFDEDDEQGLKELVVISIVDYLTILGVDAKSLTSLESVGGRFISNVGDKVNARTCLSNFLEAHGIEATSGPRKQYGDVTSINGRDIILQRTRAAIAGKDNQQKLDLLQSMLTGNKEGEDDQDTLHWSKDLSKLLAVRFIVASIEEMKGQKRVSETFGLPAAYTILAEHFPKVTEIREFCLISETLELMLKTKGHSMSQYNIDSTIGAITIFCSVQGKQLLFIPQTFSFHEY